MMKMKLIRFWMVFLVLALAGCAAQDSGSEVGEAFDRGMALFNQGQYAEAVPEFTRVVELDPDFSQAYLFLGRSYVNLGQWRDAIAPLRTAYRLAPADIRQEALNLFIDALLGGALQSFKFGEYQQSITYLKEGLEVLPESEKLQSELLKSLGAYGQHLIQKGDVDQALAAFREILQTAPENVDALVGMAQALIAKGDLAQAMETIRKALSASPGNPDVMEVFKELLAQ